MGIYPLADRLYSWDSPLRISTTVSAWVGDHADRDSDNALGITQESERRFIPILCFARYRLVTHCRCL